jgi:putative zinc finger protein
MTHPDELMLAGYVDRSLPEDELRAVAEHLASCDVCRDEVELASAGRAALASLPVVGAPPIQVHGTGYPDRVAAASPSGPPRWYRALAGVAAAAALVAVVAVVVPKLGSTSGEQPAGLADAGATAGGGAESGATPQAPTAGAQTLFDQPIDYDAAGLQSLAEDQATDSPTAFDSAATREAKVRTLTCISSSTGPDEELRAIIAARFEGTPAWIGVYAHRSAADSVDRIVVRALGRDDCSLLSEAEAPA